VPLELVELQRVAQQLVQEPPAQLVPAPLAQLARALSVLAQRVLARSERPVLVLECSALAQPAGRWQGPEPQPPTPRWPPMAPGWLAKASALACWLPRLGPRHRGQ
jgi:hypothetical protein